MGGTFDNIASCDGSPVLVRMVVLRGSRVGTDGWGVRVVFKCALLGPGGPDRQQGLVVIRVSGLWLAGWCAWFLQPHAGRRVAIRVGGDRTLRTTQWTRASSIHATCTITPCGVWRVLRVSLVAYP